MLDPVTDMSVGGFMCCCVCTGAHLPAHTVGAWQATSGHTQGQSTHAGAHFMTPCSTAVVQAVQAIQGSTVGRYMQARASRSRQCRQFQARQGTQYMRHTQCMQYWHPKHAPR
jgi:hypothetical protein